MAQGKIGAAMSALFGKQPASGTLDPNAGGGGESGGGTGGAGGKQVDPNSSAVLEGAGESGIDGSGKKTENPLDKFSDIWHPPMGADGKPIPKKQAEKLFNVEPKAFFEHAAKQDFRKFVKPEALARVAKGGDDANAALSEIVQDLGSNLFATSSLATTKMIERAMEHQTRQFEASLPELFKKMNLGENLRNKHPALNHPASQPIVEALRKTLAENYPDATTAELQETAEQFLTTFATEVIGKKPDTGGKGGTGRAADTDWSTFLPEFMQSQPK